MRSFRLRWFPLGSYPRTETSPAVPVQVALQYLNCCGLPRAIGPQKGKDLPRGNLQVYASHSLHSPIGLAKASNLNGQGVGLRNLGIQSGRNVKGTWQTMSRHAGGKRHLDRRCNPPKHPLLLRCSDNPMYRPENKC